MQIFWCQHDKSFLDEFWSKHVFIKLSGENMYEKRICFISLVRSLAMAHLLTKIIISFQRENNLSCWTHIKPFFTILSLASLAWPPTRFTPTYVWSRGWPWFSSRLFQLSSAESFRLLVNSNNVNDRGPKLLCNENKTWKWFLKSMLIYKKPSNMFLFSFQSFCDNWNLLSPPSTLLLLLKGFLYLTWGLMGWA